MFQILFLKTPSNYGSASDIFFPSQARKYQKFAQLKVGLRIRALKLQCFLPSVNMSSPSYLYVTKPCVRLNLRTPFSGR